MLAVEIPRGPEFNAGLRAGLLAVALGVVIGLVSRVRGAPIAGLLFTAATLVGLDRVQTVPDGLLWGSVALAASGLLADLLPVPVAVSALLALPGAWLVATRGDLV